MPDQSSADELSQLRRRVELLEAENQRLREQIEPIFGPPNPCFQPREFQRAFQKLMLWLLLPVYLLGGLLMLLPLARVNRFIPRIDVLGVPLIDVGGLGTRHPGIGLGIVGVGGVGLGVIGIGGLGVGLFAIGGGAIGLIAMGGGAVGVIAVGGGACGYIAIGGGACGYYALGQRGRGRFVLALNRQNDQAVEFFASRIPALRRAVTCPMPVILLKNKTSAAT